MGSEVTLQVAPLNTHYAGYVFKVYRVVFALRIELSAVSRCMAPCIELYLLRIVLCMETVYVDMYDQMYLKSIDTCIILRAMYRHV